MKRLLVLILPLLLTLLIPRHVYASDIQLDNKFIDEFSQYELSSNNIPGAAVAVVSNDKISYMKGYGIADEGGRKVTAETPFIIGSISKSITAVAVMQLKDKGLINIDEPVVHYIPWFKTKDIARSNKITVRDLLNQTSGLPVNAGESSDMFFSFSNPQAKESMTDFVKNLSKVHQDNPGKYSYANANYVILGVLIEDISKKSFKNYIEENIFSPLEMNNSFLTLEDAQDHGLSTGYTSRFGLNFPSSLPYLKNILPAGFIVSSAEDMSHFMQMQLNEGKYNGKEIISEKSLNEIQTPPKDSTYGMGLIVGKLGNGAELLGHDGAVPNYYASMNFSKSKKVGVIVLTNLYNNALGQQSAQALFSIGIISNILQNQLPNEVFLTSYLFVWSYKQTYIYYGLGILLEIYLLFRARKLISIYQSKKKKILFFLISGIGILANFIFGITFFIPFVQSQFAINILYEIAPDLVSIYLLLIILVIINCIYRIKQYFNLGETVVVPLKSSVKKVKRKKKH